MKLLAFLQNMWVKDVREVEFILSKYPGHWNRIVKSFLLDYNNYTGNRIKKAFGTYLADNIIYDECTKEIADNPKTICKPDLEHIKATIERIKPDAIITFGNIAFDSVSKVYDGKIYKAPHPAARQKDTMIKLIRVASEIDNKFEISYKIHSGEL